MNSDVERRERLRVGEDRVLESEETNQPNSSFGVRAKSRNHGRGGQGLLGILSLCDRKECALIACKSHGGTYADDSWNSSAGLMYMLNFAGIWIRLEASRGFLKFMVLGPLGWLCWSSIRLLVSRL